MLILVRIITRKFDKYSLYIVWSHYIYQTIMSDSDSDEQITIDEYNHREKQKKKEADISQKYKDMLQNILEQMEKETGKMYKITVNTFGIHYNYNCVIGGFNREYKIQVCEMKPEYKELEGIYNNKNEIYQKVRMLKANERYYDFKEYTDKYGKTYTIGKCKRCHSYNENIPTMSANNIENSCCQNDKCVKRIHFTKWDNIELDQYTDQIWDNGGGGSISVCHKLGKWKMIKD